MEGGKKMVGASGIWQQKSQCTKVVKTEYYEKKRVLFICKIEHVTKLSQKEEEGMRRKKKSKV